MTMTLYQRPGWGSVLIEAQLAWYGLPFRMVEVGDLFADDQARRDLERVNPLAQIPTLVLEDGTVMTESAATTLWLAEQTGRSDLVPAPSEAERALFLKWLIFVVANIYPTYTYFDRKADFLSDPAAQAEFAESVTRHAQRLYRLLDGAAIGPWFLGERFSALDIFVCTLTHWNPERPWFDQATPSLVAITEATKAHPTLASVWRRNFP